MPEGDSVSIMAVFETMDLKVVFTGWCVVATLPVARKGLQLLESSGGVRRGQYVSRRCDSAEGEDQYAFSHGNL
jgi:hypothetical protein